MRLSTAMLPRLDQLRRPRPGHRDSDEPQPRGRMLELSFCMFWGGFPATPFDPQVSFAGGTNTTMGSPSL